MWNPNQIRVRAHNHRARSSIKDLPTATPDYFPAIWDVREAVPEQRSKLYHHGHDSDGGRSQHNRAQKCDEDAREVHGGGDDPSGRDHVLNLCFETDQECTAGDAQYVPKRIPTNRVGCV